MQKLQRVSPESLGSIAETYLQPAACTLIACRPTEAKQGKVLEARNTVAKPDFVTQVLPNKLQLLTQKVEGLPKVHIRFLVLGGSVFEAEGKRGIACLLATMLTRDTQKRSAAEVAEVIESIGGRFNEYVGNNSIGFSLEVLSNDLPIAMELLNDAVNGLKICEDTFAKERDTQIAAIQEQEDEILELGKRHLRKQFFAEHPYAVGSMGLVDDLKRITVQDLCDYHKEMMVGNRIVVSVSGQFDEGMIQSELAPALSSLPSGSDAVEPLQQIEDFKGSQAGAIRERVEREQAVVMQAFPDVGVLDEETFLVGEVVDELCSGMSSNLFKTVREDLGLAYYVGSSRMSGVKDGMFYFYAGTQIEKVDAVKEQFRNEIKRLQSGELEAGELEACIRRLSVQRRQHLQMPSVRAMQSGLNALYGLEVNHWKCYDANLKKVSQVAVAEFAQTYLKLDQAVELVIGPK